MTLVTEGWECNMAMCHNEGREPSYRRRNSEMSQVWMDLDNATSLYNVTEETTSNPNLDVIASSPDLQWLLQSSIPSQSETNLETSSPMIPSTMPNCPYLSQSSSFDLSCVEAVGDSAAGHTDKHMSSEKLERIRIRRERNRVAAAKCRDRRRVLIDTLQIETDHLEQVKTQLEEEIVALEREREKLEIVFEAHKPFCKLNDLNPE
ncbi:protein c-Fos-like isoform X2 [Myxocyprinus asiaticus]|uniref:protein c-Fos-like isoform X2 n=1 Tax=Myxocyprinus asiaticus TaxID=70543 RepID=UPI002222A376|nr:protein c-Fos-like isoform X2 [Myxocyprinus asiaticus]